MFARDAAPSDYDHFVACFQALEVPEAVPSAAWYEERLMPWSFVACDGDVRAGWGYGVIVGRVWHVGHVATLAAHRGRGVGRAIMDEHARRARAAGKARWRLNVKPHNAPAIRLYERCGMQVTQRNWSLRLAWRALDRVPASPPARAFVLPASDDAQVEAAFALDRGELADRRARPGRVVLGVRADAPADARADDRVVAWASFDPSFPGASPFRPSAPAWSRALLDAIRAHAWPEHDHVRVMVEGDEPLARLLIDHGLENTLETLQMEGDVPLA